MPHATAVQPTRARKWIPAISTSRAARAAFPLDGNSGSSPSVSPDATAAAAAAASDAAAAARAAPARAVAMAERGARMARPWPSCRPKSCSVWLRAPSSTSCASPSSDAPSPRSSLPPDSDASIEASDVTASDDAANCVGGSGTATAETSAPEITCSTPAPRPARLAPRVLLPPPPPPPPCDGACGVACAAGVACRSEKRSSCGGGALYVATACEMTDDGACDASTTPRSVCHCFAVPSSEIERSSEPRAAHASPLTRREWPRRAAISISRPAAKAHLRMTPSCDAVSTCRASSQYAIARIEIDGCSDGSWCSSAPVRMHHTSRVESDAAIARSSASSRQRCLIHRHLEQIVMRACSRDISRRP